MNLEVVICNYLLADNYRGILQSFSRSPT